MSMDRTAMDRLSQFREVYRNLNLFPLFTSEEIRRFRVSYGQETLGKLRRELMFAEEDSKIIFTGH